MHSTDLDLIKGYSTLLVNELHKVIFDEAIFDKMTKVLKLAEEMECHVHNMRRKKHVPSNVIPFWKSS